MANGMGEAAAAAVVAASFDTPLVVGVPTVGADGSVPDAAAKVGATMVEASEGAAAVATGVPSVHVGKAAAVAFPVSDRTAGGGVGVLVWEVLVPNAADVLPAEPP